ncbi:MAG: hypothetical protein WC870_02810 [Candidatus Paceibacterota bacterium]
MWLTVEKARHLRRGILEIVFIEKCCMFLGKIEDEEVVVTDGKLSIKIALQEHKQLKGVRKDLTPTPSEYVVGRPIELEIDLTVFSVENLGPSSGEVGGGDRIFIISPDTKKVFIFYPASDIREEEYLLNEPSVANM